jgi:hypothetical protein
MAAKIVVKNNNLVPFSHELAAEGRSQESAAAGN